MRISTSLPKRGWMIAALVSAVVTAFAIWWFARAQAWEPLRAKNPAVEAGNEAMRAGDYKAAHEHYSYAAKQLPEEPGVHLNRGLALRALEQIADAEKAFATAAELDGNPAVRAEAYFNFGLARYQRGDALSAQQQYGPAKEAFTGAVTALEEALRLQPGHARAGWNLELALRRLEQAQQAEQQQQQEQDQENAQNEESEQQKSQSDRDDQEQQPQSEDSQSDQGEQGQDEDSQQPPSPDSNTQQPKPERDQQAQKQQQGEPSRPAQQPEGKPKEPATALPADARRVLDALQEQEENLERQKALIRAARENRRPTKDW